MTVEGWPAGDPRRYFDAPIDPVHLRDSSPNIYRRALWIAIGVVVGGGLVALGVWAAVDGRWWSIVLGVLAALVGVGLLVRGATTSSAGKPYRGGQLAPGLVVEQADATVQVLVLGDTSRDPAASPAFAYRLVTFLAREGTTFVPGQWLPCVLHGYAAPPWSGRWWSFDASPVAWATGDAEVLDRAGRVIPQAEWDQLLAGVDKVAHLRRKWNRLERIAYEQVHESLRRPPTRLGVPVEWQADGRARFVGSVATGLPV
ncbi:DUF3239 domain-containing protein [Prauserella flavalba]|uniref:DUF3239 domain-containing protein n=1 Tax=Prauserella flavalba TaxID=1477506 RepID=A0A318M2C1_9PSEU|nr:DUF3239 domain-containing protein [Prauserella flavalba]PXY24227.1 hypothetical protein BA062_28785 [Prauserella flavalba]